MSIILGNVSDGRHFNTVAPNVGTQIITEFGVAVDGPPESSVQVEVTEVAVAVEATELAVEIEPLNA